MYVYIAPLKDKDAFKIGKSEYPKERIFALSSFYLFATEKIVLIKCGSNKEAYSLEDSLHRICKHHNVKLLDIEGREFFSNEVYDKVIEIAKLACGINHWEMSYLDSDVIEELNLASSCNYSDIKSMVSSIGMQIRDMRLKKNIDQRNLAESADVALNVIKRLESGRSVNTASLVKVLVVLGKTEWLSALNPNVYVSPMDILRLGRNRQRASKKRSI